MKKINFKFLFLIFLFVIGNSSCTTHKNDGNSPVVDGKTYGDKFKIKPNHKVNNNTIIGGATKTSGENGSKPK